MFFPTEPLGNDQVLETRPVSLGWMDADFITGFFFLQVYLKDNLTNILTSVYVIVFNKHLGTHG